MVYQDVAIKSDSGFVDYLFGADLMMTAKGKFGFNYRAICKKLKKSERSNTHGEIQVSSKIVINMSLSLCETWDLINKMYLSLTIILINHILTSCSFQA